MGVILKKGMIIMALFGFIGVGNMGGPLLKSAVSTFGKEEVVFTSATIEHKQVVAKELGIPFAEDNRAVAGKCKYLVLAVKPQTYPAVLEEIKDVVTNGQIIISLAVGVTIATIKERLAKEVKVVRAMPNTPALVSQGMTGISFSEDSFSLEEREIIDRFFSSFGKYEVFKEELMNAVSAASGSSPAYAYMFIEALADSVVSYGIPREKAYTLAAQTLFGAAAMVLKTGEHPGMLKDNVCSPGGTTIAAVKALEEHGFRNAIMKATDACMRKAEEMSKK